MSHLPPVCQSYSHVFTASRQSIFADLFLYHPKCAVLALLRPVPLSPSPNFIFVQCLLYGFSKYLLSSFFLLHCTQIFNMRKETKSWKSPPCGRDPSPYNELEPDPLNT